MACFVVLSYGVASVLFSLFFILQPEEEENSAFATPFCLCPLLTTSPKGGEAEVIGQS